MDENERIEWHNPSPRDLMRASSNAFEALIELTAVMRLPIFTAKENAVTIMDYVDGKEGGSITTVIDMMRELRRAEEENDKNPVRPPFEAVINMCVGTLMLNMKLMMRAVNDTFDIPIPDKRVGLEQSLTTRLDMSKLSGKDNGRKHINGILKDLGMPELPDSIFQAMFGGVEERDGFHLYDDGDKDGGFDEEEY